MKELGNILESVADAISDSLASRTRRNAGAGRLIAPPPPGTPLLVSLALALEHTGVYLGDNKVAELQDDGFVKTVSLTDFINGDTAPFPLRNGTRIFAACDARSRKPLGTAAVAKMARRLSDEAYYAGYDLIQSNCHLFVAACAAGLEPNDTAFAKLVGKGFASIGRLESVLARKLNGGHRIEWCPVARNKERFHYKLTEGKVVRLKMEGKCERRSLMFDWLKQLFTPRWSWRCPLCGSSRMAIKIRRKMPYVVDGPTFAYYTCRTSRHTWSHPIRIGI